MNQWMFLFDGYGMEYLAKEEDMGIGMQKKVLNQESDS